MGQSYEDIYQGFSSAMEAAADCRSDPEQKDATLIALANAMKAVLEKLRYADS